MFKHHIDFEDDPLAAKIIEVICQDTRAFILWTSSNTYFSDDTYKEILKYKRSNDLLFATLEKPNWNGTNTNIKLIEVTDLKPNTEYLFSVLTLSRHGSANSNNETCITYIETAEGKFLLHEFLEHLNIHFFSIYAKIIKIIGVNILIF